MASPTATPPTTLRAIGYIRLSRATEASTSPERQRQDVARLAAARGWELTHIVEDIDVSATRKRLDRPGIHEIRRLLRSGAADVVLVSRLDRIARSVADVSLLLDEGVPIVSAAENFDTASSSGRAMAQVAQVFAELEARTIGARVSSSRRHLPTVGRWAGGPPPYGFTTSPIDGAPGRTLAHDPVEAPVVRRMVDEVLAGKLPSSIAQGLNSDGIPPRRGSRWSAQTVGSILRHGSSRGYATVQGDYVRDERGLPAKVWPALVTPEEARVIDERLAPGRKEKLREGPGVAMLHGVALCSGCSRPLTARHWRRPDLANLYTCQSRNDGIRCPRPQTATASRLEPVVEAQFLRAWGHVEVIETVTTERPPEGLAEVLTAIAHTQEQIGQPGADVMALAQRMLTLGAERDRLSLLPGTAAVERATGETYAQRWERSDDAERRAILRGAGIVVVVHPARARGHWNDDRVEYIDELAGALDD